MTKATSKKKAVAKKAVASKTPPNKAEKKADSGAEKANASDTATAGKSKPVAAGKPAAKKAAPKKASSKASSSKTAAANPASTKKTASKKTAAAKTSTKKATAKKSTAPKASTQKQEPEKTLAKKSTAKKSTAKKATSKKTASKPAAKKTASAKSAIKDSNEEALTSTGKAAASVGDNSDEEDEEEQVPRNPFNAPVVRYERKKDSDYMNPDQLDHFRRVLAEWKQQLMEEVDRTVGHMKDDATNFPDPNDRATQEEEFSLELRTRDRERKLIKKINEAQKRIDDDEYGYCETCGIEIGFDRLQARPTAELCIDCKTLEEIRERQIA